MAGARRGVGAAGGERCSEADSRSASPGWRHGSPAGTLCCADVRVDARHEAQPGGHAVVGLGVGPARTLGQVRPATTCRASS